MQANINILIELKEAGAATLLQANNGNCYSVPDDYFNNLSSLTMANIFISKLPAAVPYKTPENYFENLPDNILDKINTASLQLPNRRQQDVFTVPEGYFDGFANSVIDKIKAQNDVRQELEEISPLLNTISKDNVYSLPETYFEELNPLTQAAKNKPSAKVVSMGSKSRRWINYAAAACISAVLFGSGYFLMSGDKTKPAQNTQQSSQSIAIAERADMQQQLADLSDSEIESYLNENSKVAVFTSTGTDDYLRDQNTDIEILIKDIPDEDIRQYLDANDLKKEEGI